MNLQKSFLFVTVFSLIFTGCTSSNANTYVNSNVIIDQNKKKYELEDRISKPIITPEEYKKMLEEKKSEAQPVNVNKALMKFYKEWKDVKYKLGGDSKNGIDCSAFTQKIYKKIFELEIPRTTRTQVEVGKEIKKSELEMGDLVFFKTGKHDRHVGIYMGNGDFMHASIKGVQFTKLNKPFYKEHYWTSRRIIED